MFYRPAFIGAVFAALLASPAVNAQTLFRAYHASTGNDANPCTVTAPCRLLPRALTVVADGGEIWMLDSANYNTAPVVIAKSVTVLAVPGAVGSVLASGGDAISVNAPGAKVSLRNLVILRGLAGGNSGVVVVTGDRLLVEGCLISGLTSGAGISVGANSRLRVIDSIVRDNSSGIIVEAGATAEIAGTTIVGNTNYGLFVTALGGTTTASVTDTIVSQNAYGAYALANGGNTRLYASRVTASKNTAFGIVSESQSGTSVVSIGGSVVTANPSGLVQSGAGAIMRTLGDNHVAGNTIDVTGTLTPLAPR